jgi:surfeit locus 1 family protein
MAQPITSQPPRARPPAAARRAFRPALWPSVAALLGCALLLALGTWQVQRLHWKEGLIATRAARLAEPPAALPAAAADWAAWEFRRVTVSGRFRHDLEQRFGVQARKGRLGHQVLTPLVRADGTAVLVERGWLPAAAAGPQAHRSDQAEGGVTLTGIARDRSADRPGWFTPANEPAARLWYSYDLPALGAALGLPLLPVVVTAEPSGPPGALPLAEPADATLPNNHLHYAITWYGLAAALVAVYVAFSLRPRPD